MSSKNFTDRQQKEFIIQEFVLQALPSDLRETYKKNIQYFNIPEEHRAKFTPANLAYLQEKAQELATSFEEIATAKKKKPIMTSNNNAEILTTMQQMLLQMQAQQEEIRQLREHTSANNTDYNVLPSSIKTVPPELFKGDRSPAAVEAWLHTMDKYLGLHRFPSDQQRVEYATTLLRGQAATWWQQST